MRRLKMKSAALLLFILPGLVACGGGSSTDAYQTSMPISAFGNDLATAVATIGSVSPTTLEVNTPLALGGDVTIPANITLTVGQNGSIDTGSFTLIINGPFKAQPVQVFSGTVKFGKDAIFEAMPEWWGAKGDGDTDDTVAINKAIAAFPTVAFSDQKTYVLGTVTRGAVYLENTMLNLIDGTKLKGAGINTVLKRKDHMMDQQDDQLNAHMIGGENVSNITIQDIRFEENGSNNLNPPGKIRNGMAIRVEGGSNITIRNVWFNHGAGTNSVGLVGTGKGALLENNRWSTGGQGVEGNAHNTDFSFVYSEWSDSRFLNNTITQSPSNRFYSGGIEIHGSNSVASGNTILNCEPGIWIASAPRAIENITVSNNRILDSHRGIAFWRGQSLKKVTVDSNVITTKIIPNYLNGNSAAISIPIPTNGLWTATVANGGVIEDIVISNNDLSDNNGRLAKNDSSGIALTSLKGARITGNRMTDFNSMAIWIAGSPFGVSDVLITGNTIRNWGSSNDIFGKAALYIDLNGSSTTPAVPQFFASNITFQNNTLAQDTALTPAIQGCFFSWPTLSMTNLVIKDNQVSGNIGTLFAGNQGGSFAIAGN